MHSEAESPNPTSNSQLDLAALLVYVIHLGKNLHLISHQGAVALCAPLLAAVRMTKDWKQKFAFEK